MKVIVAGGRNFNDRNLMCNELEKLVLNKFLTVNLELICGMAKGADLLAKSVFENNGMTVHERPADWKNLNVPKCVIGTNQYGQYNKLAGMNRNHSMGDEADVLVAFWDGKSTGTKDMIDYMQSLNKPVHVVKY